MTVLAVIPARGGSKGVPGKNLIPICGMPLIARAVASCRAAETVDRVVVSTDSGEIADVARSAGAEVVARPAALSGDTASSESALVHALDLKGGADEFDVVVLVQCTSPFIDPADIDRAVSLVRSGRYDSVFSAAPDEVFLWSDNGAGGLVGVNHDPAVRPRRQDRPVQLAETGAFYAMRVDGFRASGHRFFGNVGAVTVDPMTALEIDHPSDVELARAISPVVARRSGSTDAARWQRVRALVTDFDGVHTDDSASVDERGVESVRVSRADGMGISRLRAAGLHVMILTTDLSPVAARRAGKLQVECLSGVDDKAATLAGWAADQGLALDEIAYLGNDVNDLGALAVVGLPASVADAHPDVRAAAVHITAKPGGHGAVREFADTILHRQACGSFAGSE